jgi:hypothetical protein
MLTMHRAPVPRPQGGTACSQRVHGAWRRWPPAACLWVQLPTSWSCYTGSVPAAQHLGSQHTCPRHVKSCLHVQSHSGAHNASANRGCRSGHRASVSGLGDWQLSASPHTLMLSTHSGLLPASKAPMAAPLLRSGTSLRRAEAQEEW